MGMKVNPHISKHFLEGLIGLCNWPENGGMRKKMEMHFGLEKI